MSQPRHAAQAGAVAETVAREAFHNVAYFRETVDEPQAALRAPRPRGSAGRSSGAVPLYDSLSPGAWTCRSDSGSAS